MYIKAIDKYIDKETKEYVIGMMTGVTVLKQLRDMYKTSENRELKDMIVDISLKIREEYPEINDIYPPQ